MAAVQPPRPSKRQRKEARRLKGARKDVAMGIIDVQVLGTGANGLAPSLVCRTNLGHYLFDAGDGLQRFCVEHKVRLGRVRGVFLTRLGSEATGGLPGALMTMADLNAGSMVAAAGSGGGPGEGGGAGAVGGSRKRSAPAEPTIPSGMHIYGPAGTASYLFAMRHFFRRPDYALETTEFLRGAAPSQVNGLPMVRAIVLEPSGTNPASAALPPRPPSSDAPPNPLEGMIMQRTVMDSSSAGAHTSSSASSSSSTSSSVLPATASSTWSCVNDRFNLRVTSVGSDAAPERTRRRYNPLPANGSVVCYVCQTPKVRGKFDAAKATALSISGRDRGRLVRGQDVTLEDGRVVRRSDVMADDVPGVGFAVVACPSRAYLPSLLTNADAFVAPTPSGGAANVCSVFHFAPADVLLTPEYQAFMARFDAASTLHVLQNATHCPRVDAMKAGQRNVILLSQIHNRVFPPPRLMTATVPPTGQMLPSGHPAQTKARVQLVPLPNQPLRMLDGSEAPGPADVQAIVDGAFRNGILSVDCIQALRRAEERHRPPQPSPPLQQQQQQQSPQGLLPTVAASAEALRDEDPEIVFLGTGSAIPSKYRNVTSILIRLASGSILLDVGEGTYSQLVRHFSRVASHGSSGGSGGGSSSSSSGSSSCNGKLPATAAWIDEAVRAALADIQLVWVSHKHGDHILGLALLLAMRPATCGPLTIVCPRPVVSWLVELSKIDVRIQGRFECVPCAHTARTFGPSTNIYQQQQQQQQQRRRVGGAAPLVDPLATAMARLGLADLESVCVTHCYLAFGVVLTHKAGWRIVFSGDTRPDRRLWTVGKGADLLIHEATFDSDMGVDARAKKHSTVAEAIAVGKNMGARHLILTHFSQRYPKLPTLQPGGGASATEAADATATPGIKSSSESSSSESSSSESSNSSESNAGERAANVSVAFDFMVVRLSELAWLPAMLPALHLLFPDEGAESAPAFL